MSIVEIVIFYLYSTYPNIASIIYLYLYSDDKNTPIMLMGERVFLGGKLKLFSTFYTTSPLISIVLPLMSYISLIRKSKKFFVISVLLLIAMFCSGTRANIVSAFFSVLFAYIIYTLDKKRLIKLGFIITFVFLAVGLMIFILLSDTSDTSLSTKKLHIVSMMKLFDSDPLRYLFVGSGVGSLFYTSAWNRYTTNCEVVYIDLIRMFGLIPFLALFFFMAYPILLNLWNKKNPSSVNKILAAGYCQYLLIGATNPLIIGSTGFCAIFMGYYLAHTEIVKELKIDFNNSH